MQGYESDEDIELGDDAVYILACLRRKKCVYMQFDDGPIIDDLKQLEEAGDEHGYWTTLWGNHQVWFVVDEEFEVSQW